MRVHDPSLYEESVTDNADSGHASLLPMAANDGTIKLRKPDRVAVPSIADRSALEALFPGLRANELEIFLSASSAVNRHRLFTTDGSHNASVRLRASDGWNSAWGMVVGIYQVHVLNDVRSPTIAYFEIAEWPCRMGRTCLPVLQEPDGLAPTRLVRPCDVYHDCVLFLDVIDEDVVDDWAMHNLIQIDPLDLPTRIDGQYTFI